MEDAATAEIARVQLWQWSKYGSKTDSGKKLDAKSVAPIFEEEAQKVAKLPGISAHQVHIAKEYMLKQLSQEWPSDFLTSDLQQYLESDDTKSKL
jgi:malate synthase